MHHRFDFFALNHDCELGAEMFRRLLDSPDVTTSPQ
jgi:hypothetical protein